MINEVTIEVLYFRVLGFKGYITGERRFESAEAMAEWVDKMCIRSHEIISHEIIKVEQ